ncbi:MAG: DUF2271 domain-containing protein [Gemmatimonadota bacterium]
MRLGFLSALLLVPMLSGARPAHPPLSYSFRHDGVLGTSLDLTFVAESRADAERAELAVLTEIERVRRLISTWDPASEASRLQRDGRLTSASPELLRVLALYQVWGVRTGGAYSARMGPLVALWKDAASRGSEPDPFALASVVSQLRQPGWRVDQESGTVQWLHVGALDLNSLGKGFILDLAVEAVEREVDGVHGGLVNIGGDIRTWGPATPQETWRVAVADPRRPADNAPPLTVLRVGDAAISSSGDYARGFQVGGVRHSHIIDPRTGRPADEVIGVTVIASDNATANALATSLSVLGVRDGMALVASLPGVECLMVTSTGEVVRSTGFARHEVVAGRASETGPAIAATLTIDVTPAVWSRHRPYVAAWVTDTLGHHLRTLAVWGDRPKYLRELSKWWSLDGLTPELVNAVTRATRSAGKYTLEWDGADQAGTPLTPGSYQFWLEVAFENGAHSVRNVTVTCGPTAASATMAAADAFAAAQVDCVARK